MSPDSRIVHRRWSVRISSAGALGGIASGLALAGGAAPWAGLIPNWAVFLLGGLICLASVIATYIRQDSAHAPGRK